MTPRRQDNYPYSDEAEKSLLSAMLNSPKAAAKAIEKMTADELFHASHRAVFNVMKEVYTHGLTIDVTTIVDQLKSRGRLDEIGGVGFIGNLLTYANPENVDSYIKIVHDKYTLRRLLHASSRIEEAVYEEGSIDARNALEIAESEIFSVSSDIVKTDIVGIRDAVRLTFDALEERIGSGGQIPGVPSGFKYLDRMTAGFKPGQLIIVAGRPGMGKTSFALNVASSAAIQHGIGTVVFSLEMATEELTERMLSAEAEIDSQKLRIGDIDEHTSDRLAVAAGVLAQSPLFINDSASMTPLEMRANLQRLMIDSPVKIGLVIVDYLQLMTSGDPRLAANRVQDVTKISRDLKVLARDLEVPIVALSQLNRSVEGRDDKRPQLSDLRESGAIEQDADLVMFIHREEIYSGPYNSKGDDVRGKAEVVVGKQRNGPIGKVTLRFAAEHTKFLNPWDEHTTQETGDEKIAIGLPFD